MGVSRSGYYKWKNHKKTDRDNNREEMVEIVKKVHQEHPSHGHRWVNAYIKINYNKKYSDNYIYKAFKYLGIKAESKHQVHYKPRKVKDKLYYVKKVDTKKIIFYFIFLKVDISNFF